MTDQELCAALRQSPRDGDGCRGAERIEGLKARLTASEAREREYDEAIVELYRLAPASTFDPAQPLLSIEGIVRDIQKASEARVEEAYRAGFGDGELYGFGPVEDDAPAPLKEDEALAAWRSQHAPFTVPGTISVTGRDATFTPVITESTK